MKKPGAKSNEKPAAELEKAEAVLRYLILDPGPEEPFDDIARLTVLACQTPVGVISFVQRGEMWLKARVGLREDATPQALALCSRTFAQREMLVVPDLERDARATTAERGAGRRPARFFAGVPLLSPEGVAVGALAVMDWTPRSIGAEQKAALAALGRQVQTQLELRRLLAELERTIGEKHRAEMAARASAERYRELFENANDIVYTHDLREKFTSLNQAGERITGWTREEILGMKIADILSPESLEAARRMMAAKVAGEPPRIYEVEIRGKNGRRIPLELSTRVIKQDAVPVGIQGIARDITERRQAAAALQAAHDELKEWAGELERRNREAADLTKMEDLLQVSLTTAEGYQVIERLAPALFPDGAGALAMLEPGGKLAETVASWGAPLAGEKLFAPEDCWALRGGKMHWVEDAHSGPICKHAAGAAERGYLCVPMMAQGEALGVLYLERPASIEAGETSESRRRTGEGLRRLAANFAEQVALALSNVRLRETLRDQSIHDALTGLYNRRYMETSLERELLRAERKQRAVGLIFLDVDQFKKFNDTHGHDAGDALLRVLGAFLQKSTRGDDIACRYGGEEFLIILPEATAEVTRQRAEELREKVKAIQVEHGGRSLGGITLSLGVAAFPAHARLAADLVHAADRALYAAKSGGRDRVATGIVQE